MVLRDSVDLRPHLVLFDIDGTLTESQSTDSALYVRSLGTVFDFFDINQDWTAYQHATDSGILAEIFLTRRRRQPAAEEVALFRAHFVAAIADVARKTPFRELAGAQACLRQLLTMRSLEVGLATGGFRDSARCKMQSAGMDYDAFPAASADDGMAREEIIQTAIARVIDHCGLQPSRITYIGDGLWDARACQRLGLRFVGIGTGSHAEVLRTEGAEAVFADYSEQRQFLDCLIGDVPRADFLDRLPIVGEARERTLSRTEY